MFKNISLAFTLCILLTQVAVASTGTLSDLSNHKNQEAIEYLHTNNIISGYPDGTFKPNNTVNRAELIKILVGGKGVTPNKDQYNNCFPDVKNEWFAPYICYAKSNNWINGYPDGKFKPEQSVNKAEAIKMLINSQGYSATNESSTSSFKDVKSTDWFFTYVNKAKELGLLEENEDIFLPQNAMSRGSISENIYRSIIIQKNNLDSFNEWNTNSDNEIIKTHGREWTINEIKALDSSEDYRLDSLSNKFIAIHLSNKNVTNETKEFCNVNIVLKDSKGNEYYGFELVEPALQCGILDPNETRSGWYTYEVPSILTHADAVFISTADNGEILRNKKNIQLPSAKEDEEAREDSDSQDYKQHDSIIFEELEWSGFEAFKVKKILTDYGTIEKPDNEYFLMFETTIKNLSEEAKYPGSMTLMIGDEQYSESSTVHVYGAHFFNYSNDGSIIEPGGKVKKFFGFDVNEMEDKDIYLIMKPWLYGEARIKLKITEIK